MTPTKILEASLRCPSPEVQAKRLELCFDRYPLCQSLRRYLLRSYTHLLFL